MGLGMPLVTQGLKVATYTLLLEGLDIKSSSVEEKYIFKKLILCKNNKFQ